MLQDRLFELLRRVPDLAGPTFSGVGVVVCNTPETLPLVPLRAFGPPELSADTAAALAELSRWGSEFHDGFHVLGADLRILQVSQYFGPPAVAPVSIEADRHIGVRYLVAQLGSRLSGVFVTGVASPGLGVAVFTAGVETRYAPAP